MAQNEQERHIKEEENPMNMVTYEKRSINAGLPVFIEVSAQMEKMHRLMLDVIKDEFLRLRIVEVNPVQIMLIYNIGREEYSAGELRKRGYYQGSNVSYNLKKLVELHYVHYEKSNDDRRSVRVSLTEKGMKIHQIVANLVADQFQEIVEQDVWRLADCVQIRDLLVLLERYWVRRIRFIY